MHTLRAIVQAFLTRTVPGSTPDLTVEAFLAAAETETYDAATVRRLMQAVRDHAIAELLDDLIEHVPDAIVVDHGFSIMSDSGREALFYLRQQGIPVSNEPRRLLRAYGRTKRS